MSRQRLYHASRKVCNGGWRNTLRKPNHPPAIAHTAPATSPTIHTDGLTAQANLN
jgi:hypothetical protein